MRELLYFSSSDLMIQVSYKKDVNSIHYFSHRELSFGERVIVEQYLLTNIAVKTEYYKKHPAMLNYIGVNSQLVKELNQFHLKNTMNTLKEKESKVKSSVKSLIDQSMSNYYFEQIGNTILEIKHTIKGKCFDQNRMFDYRKRLEELIDAYNAYSEKAVELRDVLPVDIKHLFQEQ